MLLLIDIFSINKVRGYENPSLEIIVIECCLTGGCPLEEAREHCFLNQSAISVVVLISFLCYCGDYVGYITVILPFLAFYLCSAYFLYLVYYNPPIMLQDDHFRVTYDEHPPFFMTLLMNNKSLNNCMLDLGVGANMMSLKVMQQLGLKVT
jgi:hypothetical protein